MIRLLGFTFFWIFSSFSRLQAGDLSCVQHLKDTTYGSNKSSRKTPRDVRVVEIQSAWNEIYISANFWNLVSSLRSRVPPAYGDRVNFLLQELDAMAKLGRLKNLNEWMGNVLVSRDSPVMSFMAEADYAVYVLRQNPNYVVTFEPEGGFYRGHPEDVARTGLRQKSIDLRIHDKTTGKLIALREVKSSASRTSPGENIADAFNKVQLVHHLQVPELEQNKSVEIGLVYFYDYDPNLDMDPSRKFDVLSVQDRTLKYMEVLQETHQLLEKPFDTVTFIDFGSRRAFYIKRLRDDSLQVSNFLLPTNSFIAFEPKISTPEAIRLFNRLQSRR